MTYAHFFAKLCQIVEKSGSITQIKIAGNPMFRSSSFHTIDPKGRIIIPARFRDVLKADDEYGVVVSIKDGCLYAYTFSEWKQLEKKNSGCQKRSHGKIQTIFPGQCLPVEM